MFRVFCKSKITGACVTGTELHYNGSIGIDAAVMEAADIFPGEQVQVLNVNNGERLMTYVIEEKSHSGKVVLYGPAARRGEPGDQVVILSYCMLEPKEWLGFKARLVKLIEKNRLRKK